MRRRGGRQEEAELVSISTRAPCAARDIIMQRTAFLGLVVSRDGLGAQYDRLSDRA